jgi:DNA recombination protein RmuC
MELTVSVMFFMGLVVGATIGGLVLALWMRGKLAWVEAAKNVAEARLAASDQAADKIGEKFQALADAALRSSQGAFIETAKGSLETVRAEMSGDLAQRQTAIEGVIQPLTTALSRLEGQVKELEHERQQMFGSLREQIQTLGKETVTLSNALRNPQVRGRWGEITLRRVAELAGMVEYCDFVEQETYQAEDGRIRPDMIVKLPGGRSLVVDAKVPLAAYLDAVSSDGDDGRREALNRHGQQVRKHVEQLSSKQYWSQFQPAPEMVVLFIPGDHFFSAALEYNPTLIEEAVDRKVLLATPTTLISVLKGISYGWREQRLAENAEQIRQVAAEVADRIETIQGHYSDTGRHLERAVEAYNRAIASWENRLLPSLRRVRELGAVEGPEPLAPAGIEAIPREVMAGKPS